MSTRSDRSDDYLICSPVSVCEKFLVPATNYKIAFLLSRKILLRVGDKLLFYLNDNALFSFNNFVLTLNFMETLQNN
jgi:hypothetical protein